MLLNYEYNICKNIASKGFPNNVLSELTLVNARTLSTRKRQHGRQRWYINRVLTLIILSLIRFCILTNKITSAYVIYRK